VTSTTNGELVAGDLLDQAQSETGLGDWGDLTLPERFAIAVDLINDVGMAASGRQAAAKNCMWLLTDRLRFFSDRQRFPISDERIVRPMFVTGEPRSGTTLMHALMAVDPGGRSLRYWQVMHPSPPPATAGADDPRRALADAEWREINAKLSKWMRSHPYNDMLGQGLPEDDRTWNFDFRSMPPSAWWRVPIRNASMNLPTGRLPSDPAAQWRLHTMMLQQFQYDLPAKCWVLKGHHGFRLKELLDAYPDATVVWLHRDPVQVAASSTMMLADILDGLVGKIDLLAEARVHLERVRSSIANTMTNPVTDDPRVFHLRYTDFVADPISSLDKFYRFSGRRLPDTAKAAMADYLANNKPDRYGKFEYSTQLLIDAGYSLDQLNEEFRPFRERFGVVIERRA
jgi:hypothetical protein